MHSDKQEIYLDNNSTTKTDDRVIDVMLPLMKDFYGNPSSSHYFGKKVNQIINEAREQTSDLINSSSDEIIFTSGATESINLAIKGIAHSSNFTRKKIVTICTEHKAVIDTCKKLQEQGYEVVFLPVKNDGSVDQELFKNSIDSETLLVIAMFVNNETGLIHDIRKMTDFAHENGAFLFCDATQAVGKIEIDVVKLNVDSLCFSGHKFHGPKGIGGLFIKKELQSKIEPQQTGGNQENDIRSGSLNSVGIVGLGEACKIANSELKDVECRVRKLRDILELELLKIPGTFVNGNRENRIYNTCNICFPNTDANVLIGKLRTIAISNGSACNSSIVEPSHVLTSMGLSEDLAFSAIRFSLSKYNTENDIAEVLKEIKSILFNNSISA